MKKVSVIIIIYNIEQYLRQCIESVLAQTYKNIEIILVDDGSTDSSAALCDEYASKDSRISVIHKRNQGSVSARWSGLLCSSGEYISMIDGDDWIEADMLEQMLKLALKYNADIVTTGYRESYENRSICRGNSIKSGVYDESEMEIIYKYSLYSGKFYEPGIAPALWSKLIRRDLFFSDYEPPDKMIRMGDDAAVSYPMIARAKKVVIDNDLQPINYRIVEGSLSRSFDSKYFTRAAKLIDGLDNNLSDNIAMREGLKYYAMFIIMTGIEKMLAEKGIKNKCKQIKEIRNVSVYLNSLKYMETIDWKGFNSYQKRFFNYLIKGKAISIIMQNYSIRIHSKLKYI